jgi:hypothetical protein
MTEHDMLLYVQRQLDAKQAQIDGLVIERDTLRQQVIALTAENESLQRELAALRVPVPDR